MQTASWVIIDKRTREVVAETFSRRTSNAVSRERYEVVPILQHLQSLNEPAA